MKEPRWLGPETAIDIQGELIARFVGRVGLRDRGALERPRYKHAFGET